MKKVISTLALVLVASTFTTIAQDAPLLNPPAGKHEKHKNKAGGPLAEVLQTLTPAEQQQFKAAKEKAESDPAVLAAKANKGTNTQKGAVREAMNAAMLKADPGIGSVLEKVKAAMKEKHRENKGKEKAGKAQ